jgi:hypothetical protein
MVRTLGSGLTSVVITSISSTYQGACGLQQHPCTLRKMLRNGGKCLLPGLVTWLVFVAAIEETFGVSDYRCSIQDLMQIRQDGSVEEYTKSFQAMQFQVAMLNPGFDGVFFTTHYVNGLMEELRSVVPTHLPDSVDQVALLARLQQQSIDRTNVTSHP